MNTSAWLPAAKVYHAAHLTFMRMKNELDALREKQITTVMGVKRFGLQPLTRDAAIAFVDSDKGIAPRRELILRLFSVVNLMKLAFAVLKGDMQSGMWVGPDMFSLISDVYLDAGFEKSLSS